jgi:PPOX class probable F420-dependent enzyme
MPKPPVSDAVSELLAAPNKAVMTTPRPNGQPILVATWYLWQDGRVLLNMDRRRKRVARLAEDPRVSMLVLAEPDWSTYVSLQGRVVKTYDDVDMSDINRIAVHYGEDGFAGTPESRRVSFLVEIDRWFGWGAVRS